jgi:C-terminal processing protease CtpA/Prc
MSITQNDIMNAIDLREKLKDVKNDDDAKKVSDSLADGADGYPVNYEFARFTVAYADFLIDQWNQGRTVTEPYWIGGVNLINPAPVHYTKPILLLTNHLDFSGGDFFPAILQDNQRVKIFGSRTAGAGGYILPQQFSNNIGVAKFSVTGSIAARLSGNPIENLGVKPDYEYDMSAEDYQNNYAPYVKAVQTAVDGLIQ